jgi:predicted nucleic acid binding AN1-type Zn finger protein
MENMEENKEKIATPKIKKTKIVCHFCNKKLKLLEQIKCNCGNYFCPKHMNRHSHNCTFDMKTQKKEELEKNNPKIGKKIVMVF